MSDVVPTEAAPDVPQEAWSGVHRGPLREGEWVRLTDQKGRRHNICLESGKRFFSNRGHFDHDELIGREEGFTVTSSAGGRVPRLPAAALGVRGLDAARRRRGLPQGRRPDRGDGRHLPRRPRGRGGRRLRRPDLLAAARGRPLRPGVVVRAARGVRRRRAPQRQPVLRRPGGADAPGLGAVPSATSPRRCRPRGSGPTGSSSTCWRPGSASTPSPTRCVPAASCAPTSPPPRSCRASSRPCGCTAASPSPRPGSRWSGTGTSRGWRCDRATR